MERFIDLHCREEWTELCDMDSFEKYDSCLDNIYLLDEMYGSRDTPFPIRPGRKMWLAYISTSSDNAADPKLTQPDFNSSQVIYFTQSYRSEITISKVGAKLRRLIDHQTTNSDEQNPRLKVYFSSLNTISTASEQGDHL